MSKRVFTVGDVVQLRKSHPCGSDEWEVLRVGMDFRMRCCGCRHVVMLPRQRFERQVRRVVQAAENSNPGEAE